MSSGKYGYVIMSEGVPVGGGSMRYHVTQALDQMFVDYQNPRGRMDGVSRSIQEILDKKITVWRVKEVESADITYTILEIQKDRLDKFKKIGTI